MDFTDFRYCFRPRFSRPKRSEIVDEAFRGASLLIFFPHYLIFPPSPQEVYANTQTRRGGGGGNKIPAHHLFVSNSMPPKKSTAATTCNPVRCLGISVYFMVSDGAAAIDFFKKAFGAKERVRLCAPDGKVGHAELFIDENQSTIYLANNWNGVNKKQDVWMYVKDCDATIKRAVAAGATVKSEPKGQFWGDRSGQIVDPMGNDWSIMSQLEDLTEAQMRDRFAKLIDEVKQQQEQQAQQAQPPPPAAVNEPDVQVPLPPQKGAKRVPSPKKSGPPPPSTVALEAPKAKPSSPKRSHNNAKSVAASPKKAAAPPAKKVASPKKKHEEASKTAGKKGQPSPPAPPSPKKKAPAPPKKSPSPKKAATKAPVKKALPPPAKGPGKKHPGKK